MTAQELELPKGWVKTNIDSIAKIIHYGYTATSTDKDTGTKYLRITDIQNNQVAWNDVPFCKITKEKRNDFLLNENDIVFARTGGTVGKSFLIKQDVPSAVFASYLIRIVLTEHTNPHFIHYFFQSGDYWHQIQVGKTGLKTNVNAQILSKLMFHLPPLNEQKRIVSKIEELFSKIDSTKQSLEQTKLQLELYRQSLLKSAFEKLGEKFDLHSLDNICMKITDGEHLRPNYTNSGIPFLTAKNITDTGVIFENIDFVSQKDAEKFRSRCNPELNDILIVSRGATVGRLCIVNTKKEFCLLGSVILLKTKKEINSKFLAFFLKSPIEKRNLVKISGSTAQQAIYLRDIKKSFIPLPPLEEQEQIISQIEQGFSLIENTQNIVNSTLQTLQTMKMSVLKNAFEGKLVPQDPNDEPALESVTELIENLKKK